MDINHFMMAKWGSHPSTKKLSSSFNCWCVVSFLHPSPCILIIARVTVLLKLVLNEAIHRLENLRPMVIPNCSLYLTYNKLGEITTLFDFRVGHVSSDHIIHFVTQISIYFIQILSQVSSH